MKFLIARRRHESNFHINRRKFNLKVFHKPILDEYEHLFNLIRKLHETV